jgi:hypothetical protein
MFDRHLNGSHDLSYYAHGPEWAFVIPRGDDDALLDVVTVCARVWNGAGALIVAADPDGQLSGDWERYRHSRPLDELWLHPALTEHTKRAVREQTGPRTFEWGGPGMTALHPAELLAPASHPSARMPMTVPRFTAPALQQAANVAWGVLEHPDAWEGRFELGVGEGDLAPLAMLGGQIGFNMASPLRVSQVSMRIFGASGTQPWPYLWIFDDSGFDELVAFWNFRSGADANNDFVSVIGLPHEVLASPNLLTSLATWAEAANGPPRSPHVLVHARAERLGEVETALSAAGLERLPEGETPHLLASPSEQPRPTWLPWPPGPNGRIVRGAWDSTTFTADHGRASFMLPQPRGYRPRGGARLVLQTLPTPLPITDTAATRLSHGTQAHARGLSLHMGTGSPWPLSLQLPDARTALTDWAADHGYETQESAPAKDARAMLQRLGDLDRLDGLVDELAVDLLVTLTPTSDERLIEKLAESFAAPPDRAELADALMAQLRAQGLLLELDARTLAQLQSSIANARSDRPGRPPSRKQLVAALGGLVALGFVRRGRNVQCPRCSFPAFLLLRELDEQVRCRGCTLEYLLPVTGADDDEAKPAYRIDELMARIVSRHNLPVLLALRALRDPSRLTALEHVWPGVLINEPGEKPFDIDLLASDGTRVFAAECKLDGRSLEMTQLQTLLSFSERVGAVPVVAGLVGAFTPEIRAAVEAHDGIVLERAELLTIGTRPSFG